MTAGDAERARVEQRLAVAERDGRKITFWWRDDDAEAATPELERLLALTDRYGLPLSLAVIPIGAGETLAARLRHVSRVAVLQHGWTHANHAAPGAKKIELGGGRPVDDILSDLNLGREKLARLFGEAFLPILVPPWNRIADDVAERLGETGLAGLSTFGPRRARRQVNTHLDIFDWKGTRGPMRREQAMAILAGEIERRCEDDEEPIGILTHHLRHEAESWSLLEELAALLANHPAASWPTAAELFRLRPPESARHPP
jgi:hypothetical protein